MAEVHLRMSNVFQGLRNSGNENVPQLDVNQCQPDETIFKRKSARYKSLFNNVPMESGLALTGLTESSDYLICCVHKFLCLQLVLLNLKIIYCRNYQKAMWQAG